MRFFIKENFFLYYVLVILFSAMPAIFIWSIFVLPIPFTPTGVLSRIPLLFPLVWLAGHINNVINRKIKLNIEYEHKQAVIDFYIAFEYLFDKDPNMKEAFVKAMTDVILRFPSTIGEAQESDSPMDKILSVFKSEKKKNLKNLKEDD